MKESIAIYQSYLLRLWQDNPYALWHASVQSVQTSEVIHFADLDALISFLWGQTALARQGESVISESVISESVISESVVSKTVEQ